MSLKHLQKKWRKKNWDLFEFRSDPDQLSRTRIRYPGSGPADPKHWNKLNSTKIWILKKKKSVQSRYFDCICTMLTIFPKYSPSSAFLQSWILLRHPVLGSRMFWHLGAGAAWKKIPGAGAAWKEIRAGAQTTSIEKCHILSIFCWFLIYHV